MISKKTNGVMGSKWVKIWEGCWKDIGKMLERFGKVIKYYG
jgi:hypothetical protein